MHIPTLEHEKDSHAHGYRFIVGCDEVGRGCLAGPVVAAAVVFAWDDVAFLERAQWCTGIRDSKMLSRKQRQEADAFVRSHALAYGIGEVSPDAIDEINIHQATLRAMAIAVKKVIVGLDRKKTTAFIDGRFTIPRMRLSQQAVIHGDARVFTIAAASVVAKEYRDQLMERLGLDYPMYGFAKHKGYGTKEHREALLAHGLSPHHRKTFCHL